MLILCLLLLGNISLSRFPFSQLVSRFPSWWVFLFVEIQQILTVKWNVGAWMCFWDCFAKVKGSRIVLFLLVHITCMLIALRTELQSDVGHYLIFSWEIYRGIFTRISCLLNNMSHYYFNTILMSWERWNYGLVLLLKAQDGRKEIDFFQTYATGRNTTQWRDSE